MGKINWAARKEEQTRKNREAFRQTVLKANSFENLPKGARIRISNFCEKHAFTLAEVFERIKICPILCASFATDPIRQNFYETELANYLASRVRDFRKLPVAGPEAFFFGESGVVMGVSSDKIRAKSLDFRFRVGDYIVFASHKYIDAEGGSQDNQFTDQIAFIEQACRVRAAGPVKIIFVAICDGPYFERGARMAALDKLCTTPGVVVCTHDEVVKKMSREVEKLDGSPQGVDLYYDVSSGIAVSLDEIQAPRQGQFVLDL